MLHENIKVMRKNKGLTQEELAIRLHVVRQTVSKWEKGLSVPDAQMLQKLAEVLETSVAALLGAGVDLPQEPDRVAEQLARINGQLAVRNRRSRKIWTVVAVILGLLALAQIVSLAAFTTVTRSESDVTAYTEIID